jgi:hypothetical protein
MVRAHHAGEAMPDLKELLCAETGDEIDVDQNEIMDIVLGRRFWPTTFDQKMLHEVLAEYSQKAATAAQKLSGKSPVTKAIEQLTQEARLWVNKKTEQGKGTSC